MPVIPVSDGGGELVEKAPSLLIAHLSYPNDPEARASFLLSEDVVRLALDEDDSSHVSVSRDVLFALHANPQRSEIRRRAQAAAAAGLVAGHMLSLLLRLRRFHPEHASIRKAIWVVHKLRAAENSEGKKLPSSPAYVREQWRRFHTVAHFFMALEGMQDAENEEFSPDLITAILARGEGSLAEAEKGDPQFLDIQRCWRAPADLTLPEISIGWDEGTPEEIQAALESYRAPSGY